MVRVCFVCLGNICRSPTAEGVLRAQLEDRGLSDSVHVDSAGTGSWHQGELPDPRARQAARARGIALESRARQFTPDDFARFDYVIAMDRANRSDLEASAETDANRAKITLFRSFDSESPPDAEVPDPYCGGEQGFEEVLDLCERASRGLIEHLTRNNQLRPSST